jgi:hypothetical protein
MICSVIESSDNPQAETDPQVLRAERRLFMLGQLAEIGMALARDLSRRVGEGLERGEPLDGGAVALEFSRVSRAVRQTIALEARLDQDREALAKMFAAERAARDRATQQARIEGRRRVVRLAVQGAIERAGGGYRQMGQLNEALYERLEDPREDDDFADLPVSALVSRICTALGVRADWDLWKTTDWAAEERRAAVEGSPYAPMTAEGAEPAAVPIGVRAPTPPRRWSG